MRPAQIAASAACTQAEGSFRVEVFVSAFGRRRFCGRVHLQTHSRRTEKRCCFVLAAAAGRASRQERCKTLEKARGEAFSAAFRYLDGCRAAFVRHAGLYAKDCAALSCLASVCTLYRRHLCHEMARRAGSLMRSVCAVSRAASALSRGAFAPQASGRDLCSMPADLLFGARCTVPCAAVLLCPTDSIRRRRPACTVSGTGLFLSVLRGFAPQASGRDLCSMPADLLFGARCTVPAPRFCFARRLRSAVGARLAPAAFARKPFYPE